MRLALAAAALVAAGCTTTPQRTAYGWDGYEDSLYRLFVEPADFDPSAEAQRLADAMDVQVAFGHEIPPGVRAHLAMLWDKAGDRARALESLRAEKAAFPESGVFVDGMLERMSR